MASKIVKASGASPDEFELSVAQELLNLEVCIDRIFIIKCDYCILFGY
jgi:hypothetical protein